MSISPRALAGWSLAPTLAFLFLMRAPTTDAQTTKPVSAAKGSSLARYVPAKDLIFLLEFDGTTAHAAAWKKSALYRLLNETKLGPMLEDLASQGLDRALVGAPTAGKPKGSEVLGLIEKTLADGFVIGVFGTPGNEPPKTVFALRNADKNGLRALMDKSDAATTPKPKVAKRGTRTLHTGGTGPDDGAWWVEGNDVVFASKGGVDAVFAAIEDKAPSALGHPIRVELTGAKPGFEPVMTAFVDLSLIPMPPTAAMYGLDGIKRVDYRWGFQDQATYSVLGISAPSPRKGFLAMLDSGAFPRFDKAVLPMIPSGVTTWTSFSFSPGTLWTYMVDMTRKANPPGGPQPGILSFDASVQQITGGLRMKEDILGPLGPRWVFYIDPEGIIKGGKARGALTVGLNNPDAAAKSIDRLMTLANQIIASQAAQGPPGRPKPVEFRKLPGANPGYQIVLQPGLIPPNLAATVAPVILVGKKQLAIGLNEAEGRAALAAEAWKPQTEFAAAVAKLPTDMIALSVNDPRTTFPQAVTALPGMLAMVNGAMRAQAPAGSPPFALKVDPAKVPAAADLSKLLFPGTMAVTLDAQGLKIVSRESVPSMTSPATTGVAVGLLLPALQAGREAARRAQCSNNLKQIALAIMNTAKTNGGYLTGASVGKDGKKPDSGFFTLETSYPPAAIFGKDGKPLLSWRVAILPEIGQAALYKEFHLDEAWDSPHNKTLIPRMPTTYACPSRSPESGMTHYLGFSGPRTMLDPKGVKMNQVLDGTSSTLLLVESTKAVPWTKPEDIPFDPQSPPSLLGAGSTHPGGFNALMADGSVRFISTTLNLKVFHDMITRDGGEILPIGPGR